MYVKVRVQAGARAEKFEAVSKDRFNISVKQEAKQNLANRRVCELVAAHYHLSPKQVRIVSGHTSPSKILSIPD
jgi:uncharacterized protein YggU (UPF0235/DUF167 family)